MLPDTAAEFGRSNQRETRLMFLCNDCHDYSNCHAGWIEDLHRSRGSCEMCRAQASCYDCHGYNFSATTESREYAQNVARPSEQPTGDEQ